MNTQTFVFMFRDHSGPRRIPALLWRDVMRGRLALPGVEGQQVKVAEIEVTEHNGQPQEVRRIDAWQLQFTELALLDRSNWQEQAVLEIRDFLADVFSRGSGGNARQHLDDALQLSDALDAFYQKMPGDAHVWQPSEDQMTQMIEQIWH